MTGSLSEARLFFKGFGSEVTGLGLRLRVLSLGLRSGRFACRAGFCGGGLGVSGCRILEFPDCRSLKVHRSRVCKKHSPEGEERRARFIAPHCQNEKTLNPKA